MKRNFYIILFTAIIISITGIINIYSITHLSSSHWLKQTVWLIISIIGAFILFRIDYLRLYNMRWILYLFSLILLLMVDIIGMEGGGAQRWLRLGNWNFQPSEFAKLTVIIIISSFIDKKWKPEGWETGDLVKAFLLIFVPVALVLGQPDLGTAGIIMLIGFLLMIISGMRWKTFLYIFLFFIISVPIMWRFMLDYQKARIISFLNPYSDPLGKGYHILQSIIAIGSGGITGKGFSRGTQSALKFLPSRHTDFAFSVWCEEHGLIGAVFLLLLYSILIFMLLRISFDAKRRFGSFLVLGIVIMLMVEMAINMLMVSGMFPVVGVPLPFFSYGGSSLLVSYMGIGIACSVIWDRITGRLVQ